MSYGDLVAVYETNCEPFVSVAQCDLFLRAASMLRRRTPAETEHVGERLVLRDIDSAMAEARKARGILTLQCGPATVYVPPDELRGGASCPRGWFSEQ